MIDQIVLVRTAANINNADLFEVQIKDGGSDDQKSAQMSFEELSNAVNGGVTPLRYKALLSQNAPVVSTVSGSMIKGQIWTLEAWSIDDTVAFNALDVELISGTAGIAGAKYRALSDQSFTFTITEMSYDGSPYVVSTDANGDLNPFVNTIGAIVFTYIVVGGYRGTLIGAFGEFKTDVFVKRSIANISSITDDNFTIRTYSDFLTTPSDDMLINTPIEIEVYP